jgi:hypothetical protein
LPRLGVANVAIDGENILLGGTFWTRTKADIAMADMLQP